MKRGGKASNTDHPKQEDGISLQTGNERRKTRIERIGGQCDDEPPDRHAGLATAFFQTTTKEFRAAEVTSATMWKASVALISISLSKANVAAASTLESQQPLLCDLAPNGFLIWAVDMSCAFVNRYC